MKVIVSEIGGVFGQFEVEEGSTIGTVLRIAGANTSVPKTITINKILKTVDDLVHDMETIYVVPNIKGNA